MIPVFQTDQTPESGNCTQACLASIFELPLADVPNAAPLWAAGDAEGGWKLINDFVAEYGMEMWQFEVDGEHTWRPPGYWIGTIRQPDDVLHAVVFEGEDFVFCPSRGAERPEGELAYVNFLIVADPAKARRGA